jgi:hypothetical protein
LVGIDSQLPVGLHHSCALSHPAAAGIISAAPGWLRRAYIQASRPVKQAVRHLLGISATVQKDGIAALQVRSLCPDLLRL